MTLTRTAALASILFAAGTSAAAPAAATAPAGGVPLRAGDTVRFHLSALPARLEGTATARCVGTRIQAIGPVEARCERSFRFEVPAATLRVIYAFRAAKGGGETRVELPATRTDRPVTFRAPAEGVLTGPAPASIPDEAVREAAKRGAGAQCAACSGSGFTLDSVEVTQPPAANLPIRIEVQSPPERAR